MQMKAYQNNTVIRNSFNGLSRSIFDLDFEDWYQNGYWKENYIPYSVLDGDRVVANVSVSPMKFIQDGKVINVIQLGTVMTEETHRKQGLIRRLIKEIELDYQDKVDGYFLFANEDVEEFYPKFGYKKSKEYKYFKNVSNSTEMTAENITITEKEDRGQLETAIKNSCIQNDLWMDENLELIMFYITKFMRHNVYRVKSQSAYVVAEIENGELHLHQVFAPQEVDLNEIIAAFGKKIKKVVLGFTPLMKEGYKCKEIKEDDIRLFVKGKFLETMEKNFLRVPILAHT